MIKLIDLLRESKQIGDLYHFTDKENLLNILKTNKMMGFKRRYVGSDEAYYVSFTRNKNLFLNPSKIGSSFQVGIIFDGDKLSTKYKFEPYSSPESIKNEYEERIKLPLTSDGDVSNIKEYIKGIIILGDKFPAETHIKGNTGPKEYIKISNKERVSDLENKIKEYINTPIEVIYKSKYPVKINKQIKKQQDSLLNKLNEGKQVGTLYHFTSLKNLSSIIQNNTLIASNTTDFIDKKIKLQCISLTRTPNKKQFGISNESECVLILDGDKLSNNYKITPYHDPNQYYFSDEEYDEMEERICKDIVNLSKYIIKIILYKINPELESLLKEKNIPYKIIK
jgi:hypothetical protein